MPSSKKKGQQSDASKTTRKQSLSPTPGAAGETETRASQTSGQPTKLLKLISAAYRYKHLLINLKSEREKHRMAAPTIKGERAAAVLARIWANEEFAGLEGSLQKDIANDLNMDTGSLGNILDELRKSVPLVENTSPVDGREKVYKITQKGKGDLEKWLEAYYGVFPDLVIGVSPHIETLEKAAEEYVARLKNLLAKGLPTRNSP